MSDSALRCAGIRLRIGSLDILNGIDFAVAPGEICGIVGPNGSGKSTFLNVVCGLVAPQAGRVLLGDQDLTRLPAWKRARAGLGRTFQLVRLVESATALENVEAGLRPVMLRRRNGSDRITLREAAGRARHALERMQAEEFGAWPVRTLSFGTRRKVEIARAVVAEPSVLLVDEPSAGVSRAHVLELERVLREEAERGCAIVVVDHDLEFIGKVAPRVVVLDAGNAVFEGTPQAAWQNPHVVEAYLGR